MTERKAPGDALFRGVDARRTGIIRRDSPITLKQVDVITSLARRRQWVEAPPLAHLVEPVQQLFRPHLQRREGKSALYDRCSECRPTDPAVPIRESMAPDDRAQ